MELRALGNSGVKVSEQILGCWVMGGSYWGGTEDSDSIAAIKTALDGGITTLDTATVYGNGRSETVVGKAIKGYDRDRLTIITKVKPDCLSKKDLPRELEDSLRRMEVDYADVYFLHYPSSNGVPIEETMEVMMKLKESGKIRAIGVSNFNQKQIEEARKYGDVDVSQPCYSLVWRQIDKDGYDYCYENNIGIIPYSTLAQGILTGKFNADTTFASDDGRSRAPLFQGKYYLGALEVVEKLKPYAEKYDRTLAQVAINWLIHKPGISAPIVGGRNEKQVLENLKASGWKMEQADFDAIDAFSREFAYTLPKFRNFFDGTIIE